MASKAMTTSVTGKDPKGPDKPTIRGAGLPSSAPASNISLSPNLLVSLSGTKTPPRPATAESSNTRGFTLVEIVIVLVILGLLAAMAVPTIQGLQDEQLAREPIAELVRMARTVRAKAIEEQRPYQIAFDRRGFHAAQYFQPYGESEEFDQLMREMEVEKREEALRQAAVNRFGELAMPDPDAPPEVEPLYYETYEMPVGTRYQIRSWGHTEWQDITAGLFERWVFQPSGMCRPLEIRIQADKAYFEVKFHPLTGDIQEEHSYVE